MAMSIPTSHQYPIRHQDSCCTMRTQGAVQACLLQYCARVSSRVVPPVTANALLVSWCADSWAKERHSLSE